MKQIRLKDCFSNRGKNLSDNFIGEILYVDIGSVSYEKGIISKELINFEEAPSRARKIVKNNDIIISTVRTYLKSIVKIEKPEDNLIVSTGFSVLKPQKNYQPKFLEYSLKNDYLQNIISQKSKGVSYPSINNDELLSISIYCPTFPQQVSIANYLNHQTTKLDKEIFLLEQKVEKLDEYKQSLIYESVTKGLDRNIPMKDSSIEWIGMIPKHWEVKRLKELFSTLNKSVISSSDADEDGKYDFYISGAKLKKSNNFNLTKEALLLPTGGSYMVHYPKTLPCAYSTDVLPIVVKKSINLKFAFYLLSHNKSYFNENYFWGSGLKHLQRNAFLNSQIIVASKIEQQQIVEYLDEQCSKIDKRKELINKKIELLKEYKQSLIFEAVTGKINIGEKYDR